MNDDRRIARWRAFVDWAKTRPWFLRAMLPLSRGTGRLRMFDRFHKPRPVEAPDFSNWESHTLAACWIGHATVLLRVGGMTILTDPVFSNRVGLGYILGTLGPARFIAPATTINALPRVDLILLSHSHFDHLDRPSLYRLPRSARIVCAAGTADLVSDLGFSDVRELPVDQSTRIGPLEITAVPVRHWGARMVLDTHRGYCAYHIRSDSHRILYGGDSAYQEFWKRLGRRDKQTQGTADAELENVDTQATRSVSVPPGLRGENPCDQASGDGVDLAVIGIGAYDPWIDGHADPEQCWAMSRHAGARFVLPMHHSTFKLSNEPMNEPLERFLRAAGKGADRIVGREVGQVWSMQGESRQA